MNFPCQHCKAIRPFSGEPLKCEVCGFTWDASRRTETDVAESASSPAEPTPAWTPEQKIGLGSLLRVVLWGILIVAVVFLAVQSIRPGKHSDLLTPGKYQLALKYHLLEDDVYMDPKPKGCDFTDPPLGDKHCQFEQDLNIVRECPQASCAVKRVYVSWRKVPD